MKTKLMYVADDGTSFDTEKECIDYEKSMNKYVIYYQDEETNLFSQTFNDEHSVKRFIADCLHDCYEDNIVGNFKLVHCGKTVWFDSTELAHFVPAHYNIDGDKLNEVFQMCATKNVKIKGYTLHGDYYLADEVIPDRNWKEACEMKEEITLPNGKTVIAHILSKEELETIPQKERGMKDCWYWTSIPDDDGTALVVGDNGVFFSVFIDVSFSYGGARLGFKNPFI